MHIQNILTPVMVNLDIFFKDLTAMFTLMTITSFFIFLHTYIATLARLHNGKTKNARINGLAIQIMSRRIDGEHCLVLISFLISFVTRVNMKYLCAQALLSYVEKSLAMNYVLTEILNTRCLVFFGFCARTRDRTLDLSDVNGTLYH